MIFDIESDGLNATKIHVFSWMDNEGVVQSTNDPEVMRQLVTGADTLVGHNIIRFDLPVLERLVGAKPTGTIIDTLPLSWYLFPQHIRHGLDDWGKRLGIAKPKIEDWDSLTYEEYKHRCEEDVRINAKLWQDLDRKLDLIYRDTNKDRLLNYMTFKMQCAADQEAYGWKLDVAKAEALLEEITRLKDEKEEQLRKAMPKTPITTVKNKPKQMYRKDGTLSTRGEAWEQLLRDKFLPASTSTPVTIVTGYEDGNPNSHEQVKEWLFNLGWKPQTFKYVKGEEFGEERKIPQVRDGSELCESVRSLSSRDPAIELLDGLSVLTHRLGVVRGFVESHENGWLKAEVAGLTNTFRFRHMKPLVNLPSVDKPWGTEIRGCLTAPDGHTLCGSDMVSLEDTTKRHYMQPLDPDYIAEMSRDGFDPHLDLAKFAGAVTQEDIDDHNAGKRDLGALRKKYKAANYSCVYGVGAAKLARTTGMKQMEAKKLIDAYWERNWSVKKAAESQKVREIRGEKWILNPVSGFWHNLRFDKDRWSTINQSTGVFCFDSWVAIIKNNGIKVIGQFHDEVAVVVKLGDETKTEDTLKQAIQKLNGKLNLNVPLDVDVQFGKTYAEIH